MFTVNLPTVLTGNRLPNPTPRYPSPRPARTAPPLMELPMHRTSLAPLATCLLVAASQAPLRADAAADQVKGQLNSLYSVLAATLTGKGADNKTMLILASPGKPISQSFDDADDTDAEILNQLADVVPKANGCFVPNGEWTYSGIYKMIMDNHQTLGESPLTKAEQDRLDAAQAWMDPDGDSMAKYTKFQTAFLDLLAQKEQAEQGGKTAPATLLAKVDTARGQFVGLQNTFDKNTNTIRELTAKGGGAMWTGFANKFANGLRGSTYKASYFPSAKTWNDPNDKSWLKVTVRGNDKGSDSSSSSSAITVAVGFHKPGISVDADFSKNDFNADAALSDKSYQISFEVKRVSITRPWLDYSVFYNRAWTLPANVFRGVFSKGTAKDNAASDVPMPAYVTTFFLVRNLVIYSAFFNSKMNDTLHSMGVHAHAEVGPFSISGGYDKRDTGHHDEAHFGDGKVECTGVQIIGMMASIPPMFPDPDPALMKK